MPSDQSHLNTAQKIAVFIIRLAGFAYLALGVQGVITWTVYMATGGLTGTSLQQTFNQALWVLFGIAILLLGGAAGKWLGKDLG